MARCAIIEYGDADSGVQSVYRDYLRETHSILLPNWLKSLGHTEQLAKAYWQYLKEAMLSGSLPVLLKELVVFMVSVTNGSPYCASAHAHAVLAMENSLTFDDLVVLTQDIDKVDLPPAMRAALKFATKVARGASSVTDEDFAELDRQGFSPEQIAELNAAISVANMFNAYAIVNDLPVDQTYRQFPIAER